MRNNQNTISNVAILGGHGSGAMVAQGLRDIAGARGQHRPIGFLNDFAARGEEIDGLPVLGKFDDWTNLPPDTLFIAAIHKPKLAFDRHARLLSLAIPDSRWATVIHPSAAIAQTAVIRAGTYVGPNATILPGANIGMHCSIRAGAYVSHDVCVGDFGFVGPNAVMSGRSRLGRGGHYGPGAVCLEYTVIGEYALVGIGSVVTRDVPDNAVALGNPARVAGEAT